MMIDPLQVVLASHPGLPVFFNAHKKNWEGLVDLVMYCICHHFCHAQFVEMVADT